MPNPLRWLKGRLEAEQSAHELLAFLTVNAQRAVDPANNAYLRDLNLCAENNAPPSLKITLERDGVLRFDYAVGDTPYGKPERFSTWQTPLLQLASVLFFTAWRQAADKYRSSPLTPASHH